MASLAGQYFVSQPPSLESAAQKIHSKLQKIDADFQDLLQDRELIRKLEKSECSLEELNLLIDKPYVLLAYFQDQIFFWSSNEVDVP